MSIEWKMFLSNALPGWLAAIGTLAIAIIGFMTLGPVIENLDLREQNKSLFIKKGILEDQSKSLNEKISGANQRISLQTNEIESLRRIAGIETENLGAIRTEVTRLRDRQKALFERNAGLTTDAIKLAGQSERLKIEIETLTSQIEKIENQLSVTISLNRRFILEELEKRAQTTYGRGITELAGAKFSVRLADGLADFKQIGTFAELLSAKSDFAFGPSYYFNDPWVSPAKTGKLFIIAQFDLPVFGILPEEEKNLLQNQIEDFVAEYREMFDLDLMVDASIRKKYVDELRSFFENDSGDDVAPKERANEKEFEEAKEKLLAESERINGNIETFISVLEVMISSIQGS